MRPESRKTLFIRRGASCVAQRSQPTTMTAMPGSTYGPAAKIASARGGSTAAPCPIDGMAMTMPPRTAAEAEVVKSYGGEIIFTPGDIVYSSSKLINLTAPTLKLEKLQFVMQDKGITFQDLHQTLDKMAGHKVHVVGDTIVDSYTYCSMIGGQTKTPTMSVLYERKSDFISGAAIINAIQGSQVLIEFRGQTPAERDRLVAAMGDKIRVQESP